MLAIASLICTQMLGQPAASLPDPWVDPGFDNIRWLQSPNCDARPPDAVVDTIVIHATVEPTLEGTVAHFLRPGSKVSAHFTIGKDGSIVQQVSTFDRAWHAGHSRDVEGREKVNIFSIGIELVNLDDGVDPYPELQLEALENIITVLQRRYPIRYITSHEFIAQPSGRKNDPKGFPWDRLRRFEPQVALVYSAPDGLYLVPLFSARRVNLNDFTFFAAHER
jgi:N-acetyl-anhydromuramyl-L-alanine amidase AmpD